MKNDGTQLSVNHITRKKTSEIREDMECRRLFETENQTQVCTDIHIIYLTHNKKNTIKHKVQYAFV